MRLLSLALAIARALAQAPAPAPDWCVVPSGRSLEHPPRFAFVRGFGGTGTGLMTQLLGSHENVSIMRGTTARLEDEGQYLQDVMPKLRWRTTETCGGSIAACPRLAEELHRGNFLELRCRVCAGWAPWWNASRAIVVEKTPDLARAGVRK